LLLHYDFEQSPEQVGSEIHVQDQSDHSLAGTVFGGALHVNAAAVGNGAFLFDGIDDYIQVNSDMTGLLNQGGPFTVSLWVNSEELLPPAEIEARGPK
jgi:hypothetical protein